MKLSQQHDYLNKLIAFLYKVSLDFHSLDPSRLSVSLDDESLVVAESSVNHELVSSLINLVQQSPEATINWVSTTFEIEDLTPVLNFLDRYQEVDLMRSENPSLMMHFVSAAWESANLLSLASCIASRGNRMPNQLANSEAVYSHFGNLGIDTEHRNRIRKIRNAYNHKFDVGKSSIRWRSDDGSTHEISIDEISQTYHLLLDVIQWWLRFFMYSVAYVPHFAVQLALSFVIFVATRGDELIEKVEGLSSIFPELSAKQVAKSDDLSGRLSRAQRWLESIAVRSLYYMGYDPSASVAQKLSLHLVRFAKLNIPPLCEYLKSLNQSSIGEDNVNVVDGLVAGLEKVLDSLESGDLVRIDIEMAIRDSLRQLSIGEHSRES